MPRPVKRDSQEVRNTKCKGLFITYSKERRIAYQTCKEPQTPLEKQLREDFKDLNLD